MTNSLAFKVLHERSHCSSWSQGKKLKDSSIWLLATGLLRLLPVCAKSLGKLEIVISYTCFKATSYSIRINAGGQVESAFVLGVHVCACLLNHLASRATSVCIISGTGLHSTRDGNCLRQHLTHHTLCGT